MWKNKTRLNRRGSGFTNQRRGQHFGRRYQQYDRGVRREEGGKHVDDRNLIQDTRHYDQDRLERVHIGIEIEDEPYSREDSYQDVVDSSAGVPASYRDDSVVHNFDGSRRDNESYRENYNDDNYRIDERRTQMVDTYDNDKQRSRAVDYYGDSGRGHRRIENENLEQIDREYGTNWDQRRSEDVHIDREYLGDNRYVVRNDKQRYERHGTDRNRGEFYHEDKGRQPDIQTDGFHRSQWKDDRLNKDSFTHNRKDDKNQRQDNVSRSHTSNYKSDRANNRDSSTNRQGSHGKSDSSFRSKSTSYKSKSDTRNTSRSHAVQDRHDSNEGRRQDNRDSSNIEHKSKHKMDSRSTGSSSKHTQVSSSKGKVDSNREKGEPKSSTREETRQDAKRQTGSVMEESFKKPVTKQHQSRQRSNSGRRIESEAASVHEEDILSIMADDDGFEREMRSDLQRQGSRDSSSKKNSRERSSKVSETERRGSKDRGSKERLGYDRSQSRKEDRQTRTGHIDSKFGPKSEPRSGEASGSRDFYRNVNRHSGTHISTRRTDIRERRNRFVQSRFRDNRQIGINNNYVGGRSGLSVASRIKDSYLRRRQTYQSFNNRRQTAGQVLVPRNEQYQTKSSQSQIHGKNIDKGKTGAILKDDRNFSNDRSLDLNDRHRSNSGDKRAGQYEFKRNFRVFSNKQNVYGSKFRNYFKTDRSSFNNKDLVSQRVKRKYFKSRFNQYGNGSRSGIEKVEKGDKYERNSSRNKSKWSGNRSVVDKNIHANEIDQTDRTENDPELQNVPIDSSQSHFVFIPNTDIQANQPQIVDQFGQIIVNQDDSQTNSPVPVQYLPQQFHSDTEQVVFIPFVNNQPQPGFPESIPLSQDDNVNYRNENELESNTNLQKKTVTSDSKQSTLRKKPLSRLARENMRKHLEIKRKQQIEKAIEKKVLAKLLKNPEISKVVNRSQVEKMQEKKIKRISPPRLDRASYPSKKLKTGPTAKRDYLEDVSDDERKYDNVSDFEDVSETEDMSEDEGRQIKRPGFRKPGQPRFRKAEYSSEVTTLQGGDTRKVVAQSSPNQSRGSGRFQSFKQSDNKPKTYSGRSVYIDENSVKNVDIVTNQKRGSDLYQNTGVNKRRSISPIEITVNNDHYSVQTSSRFTATTNADQRLNRKPSDFYRYNKSDDRKSGNDSRILEDRHDDQGSKDAGSNQARYYGHQGRGETRQNASKGLHSDSADSGINAQTDNRGHRNWRDNRNIKTEDRRESGKYEDKHGYTQENRPDFRDHNRFKYGESFDRDRGDKRGFGNEEERHTTSSKWEPRYTERKGQEENEHDMGGREDMKRRNFDDNSKTSNIRISGKDKPFTDNRRNIQTHDRQTVAEVSRKNILASSMNQGQHQMAQPLMQQSMQPQTFLSAQSQSVPMQIQNSNSIIDHSLPPVQNSPMPAMAPPSLAIRQDMSLPPQINVGGIPTSMIIQQPNNLQFQQQPMQQVSMQPQQIQNMQPQFQQQQQQFQQIQQQPQMMQQQQQLNQQQFQSPVYQSNIRTNHQMPMQQMYSGQFAQNQTVMMPVNQNLMQSPINQQAGILNPGQGQSSQVIQTSMNQQSFMATTPQTAVRTMLGRVRVSGTGDQVSKSSTVTRQIESPSTSRTPILIEDSDDEDDEYLPEMLCSKCDKVYLSRDVMKKHGKWHNLIEIGNNRWKCDQCEQGFNTASAHAEHMSSKHTLHCWICPICDKTFRSSKKLESHINKISHAGLKMKFVCPLCPASFMQLSHLVVHRKEYHSGKVDQSGFRK